MIRLLLSTAAVAVLLAAPAVMAPASAATKRTHKPVAHHMKPAKMKAAPARSRDGGAAAVDALNEQSLARARGAQ